MSGYSRWEYASHEQRLDHIEDWLHANGGSQTAIVLLSDGAGDYAPESSSGMTKAEAQASSLPKEFRGPDDPSAITGWTLADYDVWIETS